MTHSRKQKRKKSWYPESSELSAIPPIKDEELHLKISGLLNPDLARLGGRSGV